MKHYQKEISYLYMKSGDLGLSPIECKDFDVKFRGLMCTADNIVLFFTDDSLQQRTKENRDSCVKMYIGDYQTEIGELEYEYKKLR